MSLNSKLRRVVSLAKEDPKLLLKKLALVEWSKSESHSDSWKTHVKLYRRWYSGELPTLYGMKSPSEQEKEMQYPERYRPMMTWFKMHQRPKYAQDLQLDTEAFRGMKVLDVGSGPFPSASIFEGCDLYCLDPLLIQYLKMGFPLHLYESRIRFIYAGGEDIPCTDGFFDAVISVNAIDHVDDFEKTAKEIRRVLKPGGRLAMHVHYHPKTRNEPMELNDEVFLRNYGWCDGLRKIGESTEKFGWKAPENERFVVWRNF